MAGPREADPVDALSRAGQGLGKFRLSSVYAGVRRGGVILKVRITLAG